MVEINKIAANEGNPVDAFALLKSAHTNKQTGEIQDPVIKEVCDLVQSRTDDIISTQASQFEDGSSAFSNTLTLDKLNNLVLETVPKKQGRYIKNKDEEIEFLKTDNAEIWAELQVTKTLTETIMDKLKNHFVDDF
ncbi:hypothetical protein Bca4012_020349 [Brassica carinata]